MRVFGAMRTDKNEVRIDIPGDMSDKTASHAIGRVRIADFEDDCGGAVVLRPPLFTVARLRRAASRETGRGK